MISSVFSKQLVNRCIRYMYCSVFIQVLEEFRTVYWINWSTVEILGFIQRWSAMLLLDCLSRDKWPTLARCDTLHDTNLHRWFQEINSFGWYNDTVKNSINHNQTFMHYFDISISSRDLHQKKLVLSSSESWCDDQLSHQESGRRRDSTDNCPRLDS